MVHVHVCSRIMQATHTAEYHEMPAEGYSGSATGAGGERVANLWVQCTNCQKWRKVSQKVNDETVPTSNDAPWHCSWDYERPGASCELPEDQDE